MRKVTLTKQEEEIVERGLQIREVEPQAAIENQLWVDVETRNIKLFKNDQVITIGNAAESFEETFTLSQGDIDRKYIMLARAPAIGSVTFLPYGGIQQRPGIDFAVEGNVISWAGKPLDGFLEEGEMLKINYLFSSN